MLNTHKPETIEEAIFTHAKSIIETNTKMLTFGGDHFISLPLLRAHAENMAPYLCYNLIPIVIHGNHRANWSWNYKFLTAVNEGLINVDTSTKLIKNNNDLDVGIEVIDVRYIHENGIRNQSKEY